MTEDSVFLSNTNNLTKLQWQLYPVSQPVNGSYMLRPRVDPNGWLATWIAETNDQACATVNVACFIRANLWPNLADNGVWTFKNAEDGTNAFFLSDEREGSSYQLDALVAGLVYMNNQTIPAPDSQRFQIIPSAQINDPVFQVVDWRMVQNG